MTRLKTDVKAAQKAQASAEAETGRQKEQLLKFKKAAEENEVKFECCCQYLHTEPL